MCQSARNAEATYLFRVLSSFFSDKVPQIFLAAASVNGSNLKAPFYSVANLWTRNKTRLRTGQVIATPP